MSNYHDFVDVRDYCESYHQALCITDANGIITYMNALYCRETGLTPAAIGTHEPFTDPISKQVIEKRQTVSFGNAGLAAPSKTGRFVTGVPIFDRSGRLVNIVITLAPEREVYRRFRELKRLLTQQQTIRVLEGGDERAMSLLGRDPKIKDIRSLIRRVAATDAAVLITGESGTGKEVIADCIQENSKRAQKPYVKINCSAIPTNMLEAELFGYEKGSFTGATSQKIGLFEVANRGTILLDEIGDIPMELQPKLLRVLQQGEIYRIGNNTPIKLDVRVIAATNNNLTRKMHAGQFREDLYYRINVFPIKVPPLRERREDISGLVTYFLHEYSQRYERNLTISGEVMQMLVNYDWPGNVRELQNVVEYYVICSEEGSEPGPEFVSQILQRNRPSPEYDQLPAPVYSGASFVPADTGDASSCPVPLHVTGEKTLFELRDAYEKLLIEDALAQTPNSSKAAQLLGIYPSSLYRKMLKYGIQLQDGDTYGERI